MTDLAVQDDSLMARLRSVHFELCKSLVRAEAAGMLPDDLEMRASSVQRDLCNLIVDIEQHVSAGKRRETAAMSAALNCHFCGATNATTLIVRDTCVDCHEERRRLQNTGCH